MRTSWNTIERAEELLTELQEVIDHLRNVLPEEEEIDEDDQVDIHSDFLAALTTMNDQTEELNLLFGLE